MDLLSQVLAGAGKKQAVFDLGDLEKRISGPEVETARATFGMG